MTFRHEVQANVVARAAQPKKPKPTATVVDWDAAIERNKAMLAEFYDQEDEAAADDTVDD